MKNRLCFLGERYYVLIILSLLHPLAMATTRYWGQFVITTTALGDFRTYELYIGCLLPTFCFIYGCISYIMTKKIFIPIGITLAFYTLWFVVYYFIRTPFATNNLGSILFFSLFPIFFAFLGTIIAAIFYLIKKFIKSIR